MNILYYSIVFLFVQSRLQDGTRGWAGRGGPDSGMASAPVRARAHGEAWRRRSASALEDIRGPVAPSSHARARERPGCFARFFGGTLNASLTSPHNFEPLSCASTRFATHADGHSRALSELAVGVRLRLSAATSSDTVSRPSSSSRYRVLCVSFFSPSVDG